MQNAATKSPLKAWELITGVCNEEAQQRIAALQMEDRTDSIFSFAFNNMLRIIGVRDGEFFHVVWYDERHQFCPSKLKHT